MTQGKHPLQLAQHFPGRTCRGVGAKVARTIPADLTHHREAGKRFVQIDPQREEGLVILQVQVIAGLVLLDQGVFQQQRLFFGIGDGELD